MHIQEKKKDSVTVIEREIKEVAIPLKKQVVQEFIPEAKPHTEDIKKINFDVQQAEQLSLRASKSKTPERRKESVKSSESNHQS